MAALVKLYVVSHPYVIIRKLSFRVLHVLQSGSAILIIALGMLPPHVGFG